MEFGVNLPVTEMGADPEPIREFARTAERVGYEHFLTYEHVLGVEPPSPDWDGIYDYTDQFHEPMVLFGHLAAETDDIEFMTGIMVLPQRQTQLVAKQAAEVDLLSDGRIRLGVGVGWNELEYENMGHSFLARGKRIEEQVELLQELWQNELVDFEGEFHEIDSAGINPLPNQQPIPIWMGGGADVVLRRIARMADAWAAPRYDLEEFEEKLDTLHGYLEEEGRDPESFPVHARMHLGNHDREDWADRYQAHADLGVTHLGLSSYGADLDEPQEHIELIEEGYEAVERAGLD